MHRKRRSQTLACVGNKQNRVIARALFVTACVGLAGWVNAATLYADKTDRELTELAAGWEALSEEQRRALLTEIKSRMHTNSDKHPVLTIQTERRYGRIVRQPDGSLVRIETTEHVVRYQALPEDAGDRPFGLGFEQRVVAGGTPPAASSESAPPNSAPASPPPGQPPVIQVGNAHHR
jgi:hypothetical protein